MKTIIYVAMLLLLSTTMQSQEKTTELTKQEINVLLSRIKDIDSNISNEQKSLKNNINNSTITDDITTKIQKYTKEREKLVDSIKTKTEDLLKTLSAQETETTKSINDLEKNDKQTNVQKTELKEKKTLLQKVKDDIDAIKNIAGKIKDTNNINLTTFNNEPRFMFMNGFDFGLENIDKLKYVGHFNIYIPVSKTRKYGINTGLLKLNNLNNDTIIKYSVDNVLNNPLDNLTVGSTYKKEYNKYTSRTSVSTYSAYFQVLNRIIANDEMALSFHLHSELLISKIRSTTTVDTIATKKITIATSSEIPTSTFLEQQPRMERNYNTAAGYFGAGITYDYHLNDKFSLFAQGTFGWSLEHPSYNSQRNNLGYDGYVKNYFYLVRSYFQYNTSDSKKTQIMIGVDFRGILTQVPLNSIYLGVNLDIEKIVDLITK